MKLHDRNKEIQGLRERFDQIESMDKQRDLIKSLEKDDSELSKFVEEIM